MNGARREQYTPQRLDPLATLEAWRAAVLFSGVAVLDAVISTARHGDQIRSPLAATLALAALLAACCVIVTASAVSRAPVTRVAHVSTIVLALGASSLSAVSTWGSNRMIGDDWGQYALALLILTVALTRPVTEIIVAGALAAVGVGTIAAIQAPFLVTPVTPIVDAIIAATPVVAMSFAAAAYSLDMARHVRRWQRSAREAMLRLEPAVREVAVRAVRQGELTLLNEGAVPLMAEILERDEISADDSARARQVGATLRARAVAAVERTWLDEAAARAVGRGRGASHSPVDDPGRLAASACADLRAVMWAFLAALARLPGFDPGSLRVSVRSRGTAWNLCLRADVHAARRQPRRHLIPYLAVLRVVADDARLTGAGGTVTLEFDYGN